MKVKILVVTAVAAVVVMWGGLVGARASAQAGPSVQVYKDASCGCCAKWIEHLRQSGFVVSSSDIKDMNVVKETYGVPRTARSCHTATVGGYVVEGHVPATEIKRLLSARPAVVGIAVPGMPVGSPGMEAPDARYHVRAYDVLAFDKRGQTTVFSTQKPQ